MKSTQSEKGIGKACGVEIPRLSKIHLCRNDSASGIQINVNILVDILIAGCVQHIVEFTNIIVHTVLLEQLRYLLSRQSFLNLIALHTEHGKLDFLAHNNPSLNIGKLN